MKKVSVIIPIYNSAKYIEGTLQSVLVQDYSTLELILVDDGTKDNSIVLAEKLLNNQMVSYHVVHQENKGLATARNVGLQHSTGEYVCFIDSDDIIDRHHVSRLVEAAENNALEIVFSSFEPTTEANRQGSACYSYMCKNLSAKEVRERFKSRQIKIHACAMLFARRVLEQLDGPFAEGLRYGEDADFIWRVLYKGENIGFVDSTSYKYLIRANSLMTTYNAERVQAFFERFHHTMCTLQIEHEEDQDLLQKAFCRVVFAQLRTTAKCTTYGSFKDACQKIDFTSYIKKLRDFDDARVRFLARVYLHTPYLFWIMNKAQQKFS